MVPPTVNLPPTRYCQVVAVVKCQKLPEGIIGNFEGPVSDVLGGDHPPSDHQVEVVYVFDVDWHEIVGVFGDYYGLVGGAHVGGGDGLLECLLVGELSVEGVAVRYRPEIVDVEVGRVYPQ